MFHELFIFLQLTQRPAVVIAGFTV